MVEKANGTDNGKTRTSVELDDDLIAWLWRERRIRERSIAWIVNNAVKQYRDRIEKGRKSAEETTD